MGMDTLFWIIGSTFAMSLIAWVGLFAGSLKEETLRKILLPLVSFSAGSLIGGAFLHLIPETVAKRGADLGMFLWILLGFSIFFLMEQFLHWHHCHRVPSEHKKPVTYLILIADGLHNFIGGLAIAGSFLVSVEVGITTWLAAAAHEIPQELGDFGILLHGGWEKSRALTFNFLSALTIVPGGILAFLLSSGVDTTFLLPFAAGNFIYIAASDLIPEVKSPEATCKKKLKPAMEHFFAFIIGIAFILAVRLFFNA
jgi:zinc and cadmium transporter